MRITVLTGGATAERAVAFASASQIVTALRSRNHTVAVVDLAGGPHNPCEGMVRPAGARVESGTFD